MSGQIIVIRPACRIEVDAACAVSLEDLEQIIGGPVECISIQTAWGEDFCQVYVHQDRERLLLPYNRLATTRVQTYPALRGVVVLLAGDARRAARS
jgi:hypothetical protein